VRCMKNNSAGIDYKNNLNEINIYPNPATNKINIEFSYQNQSAILKFYDLTGNIVLQKQIEGAENVVDISLLTRGVYIVEISDTYKILQTKLIKK